MIRMNHPLKKNLLEVLALAQTLICAFTPFLAAGLRKQNIGKTMSGFGGNVFALLQEDNVKKAKKEEKRRAQKEKEREEQLQKQAAEPQVSPEELEKAIFSQQINISSWADEDDEEEEEAAAQSAHAEDDAEPGWSKVRACTSCWVALWPRGGGRARTHTSNSNWLPFGLAQHTHIQTVVRAQAADEHADPRLPSLHPFVLRPWAGRGSPRHPWHRKRPKAITVTRTAT